MASTTTMEMVFHATDTTAELIGARLGIVSQIVWVQHMPLVVRQLLGVAN